MSFKALVEHAKAVAMADKLQPNELSEYMFICRQYSKNFNTPLHVVMNDLDPEHVILTFFQNQYDDLDTDEHMEDILDMIYEMRDPNYSREKREELKEFIKQAKREEKARIAAGKPIHPSMKSDEVNLKTPVTKNTSQKEAPGAVELPTGGSIDLSRFNQDREE